MEKAKQEHAALAAKLRRAENLLQDRAREKEACREMAEADAESRRAELAFRRTEFLRGQAVHAQEAVVEIEVGGWLPVAHVPTLVGVTLVL
jgi:hypothetical protein